MNAYRSTFTYSVRSFSCASLLFACFTSPTVAQSWQQTDKLNAPDAAAGDQLGSAVALQGGISLVGADSDDADAGSAYLFEDDGMGNWLQLTKLVADDAAVGDLFGTAVALSGNTALVGAIGDNSSAGSAYLFQDSGTWSQVDKLTASDAISSDNFGFSVALSGNTALVSAPRGDTASFADVGAAYLFQDNGLGNWLQIAKLTASDAASMEEDRFGESVALSGNLALVGAWLDDDAGVNAGAAYLFEDDGLGNWSQIAKLTAGDALAQDNFGLSVAISGNTVLIGAPSGDASTTMDTGAAYLFQDDGSGNWNQIAKLSAADAALFDQFGFSVALGNGTALVGAFFDGFGIGSAYLFEDDGSGNWSQVEKLTADDAAASDQFGEAVALDGNTALVGAIGSSGTGGAYVFTQFSAADFNEDGDVNGIDLTSWQTGYGTPAGAIHIDGDADEDEDVDGADFLIWQREFMSPGPLSSLSQVPEPSSLSLAALSLAITSFFVIAWRGRRRHYASSVMAKHERLIF